MDLIDKIKEIAVRIPKQLKHIETEEATKNALVMPFISALGYDVFNPMEVVPEFTADVGTKKGEKVDYAIKKDGAIIILIECKPVGAKLDPHTTQLYRYFSVTDARFSILTNGTLYRFYSDIEAPNKMDEKPFYEFDMQNFANHHVEELKKFTKSMFDLEHILSTASELKYTDEIKKYFAAQIADPDNDFIKHFASDSKIYSGRMTQNAIEQFGPIVKNALNQYIRERVNDRLKTALEADKKEEDEAAAQDREKPQEGDVVTTKEEIDAFNIVRSIGREVVDVARIEIRDAKSYCAVFLDDNNRKPICRFHFNTGVKSLGLFKGKKEAKVPIDRIEDIFDHGEAIKSAIKEYLD